MILEWSADALADLNRFAEFLHERYPHLAGIVGAQIVEKAASLIEHPFMGRPIVGHEQYRQMVLRVLNADYIFQYRVSEDRLVMLRIFHAREAR